MGTVVRLHRVAFAVADLDAAHRWAQSAGAGLIAWAEDDLIRAQQYEFAGGGRVELLSPTPYAGESTPVRRFLRRAEPRIHHLTILVDDFDVAVRRLRSSGLPVGRVSERFPGWLEGYLAPADTGNVLVQIAHWSEPDDTAWAKTVSHVPQRPRPDGLEVLGARLRHDDIDRARATWEMLGGTVVALDWNEFSVEWPDGKLQLWVSRGDPGPAALVVRRGAGEAPYPEAEVFGPYADVTAGARHPHT